MYSSLWTFYFYILSELCCLMIKSKASLRTRKCVITQGNEKLPHVSSPDSWWRVSFPYIRYSLGRSPLIYGQNIIFFALLNHTKFCCKQQTNLSHLVEFCYVWVSKNISGNFDVIVPVILKNITRIKSRRQNATHLI